MMRQWGAKVMIFHAFYKNRTSILREGVRLGCNPPRPLALGRVDFLPLQTPIPSSWGGVPPLLLSLPVQSRDFTPGSPGDPKPPILHPKPPFVAVSDRELIKESVGEAERES